MQILINIQKYFIVSLIFWILLLHVRFLWHVSLYSRRNLGNLSIRCLISIRKYPIENSLSKYMANLICVRNSTYLQNFKRMGLYKMMVNRMLLYLQILLKCLIILLIHKWTVTVINFYTIILNLPLVKIKVKNNIFLTFGLCLMI